ncbi:hypothetical protein ABEB36_009792 [Hypothenemus hampei]|uniref:Uncharacterized protein n=1 Tax=Hypothenemus hampei TaxID=57062 RepID=A0ABD1ELK2_HYPHA
METYLQLGHKALELLVKNDETIVIPEKVLQLCQNYDMIVLNFLYQSYKKDLNGVILNIEQDFNSQLQVSTFLGSLKKNKANLSLVICTEDTVCKWHYFLSLCGSFKVHIITGESNLKTITENENGVLIVTLSNVKLLEKLINFNYLFVVIENFEEIVSKIVVRKLEAEFKIGITDRNFYLNPDQKLQWSMLNWANPGCVGKLNDFYEIDNENFTQFRDNYKEWWFRLTWNFCESFVKPNKEDKELLNRKIEEWTRSNNISTCFPENKRKTKKSTPKSSSTSANTFKKNVPKNKKESPKKYNLKSEEPILSSPKREEEEEAAASINTFDQNLVNLPNQQLKIEENSCDLTLHELLRENEKYMKNSPDYLQNNDDSMSSSELMLCSLVRNKRKSKKESQKSNCSSTDSKDISNKKMKIKEENVDIASEVDKLVAEVMEMVKQ